MVLFVADVLQFFFYFELDCLHQAFFVSYRSLAFVSCALVGLETLLVLIQSLVYLAHDVIEIDGDIGFRVFGDFQDELFLA